MSDQQQNTVDRLHRLVTTMTNDDISTPQTDKRTRFIERCQIAFDAIETIRALDAEVVRLQSMVAQMNGLANEGIDAPNAAYRRCERIDEVARIRAERDAFIARNMTPHSEGIAKGQSK